MRANWIRIVAIHPFPRADPTCARRKYPLRGDGGGEAAGKRMPRVNCRRAAAPAAAWQVLIPAPLGRFATGVTHAALVACGGRALVVLGPDTLPPLGACRAGRSSPRRWPIGFGHFLRVL